MLTIGVTGGGGLVGRNVVQKLLANEQIAEIRVIDRQSTSKEENRRLKNFQLDLNDRKSLENALKGCDGIVHCAHAPFPIFNWKSKEEKQQMWRDNLDATESLVDAMKNLQIKILVNVGCAYCPIPNEDNYGLSQDVFLEYPRNYMLDEYGESRTRAEMYARKAAKRGHLHAIFLRPTFIYGPGASSKLEKIKSLAAASNLPLINGERRGMHQFCHAENLAEICEKSIFALRENPRNFNEEIVFCMDETCVFPVRDFFAQFLAPQSLAKQCHVEFWPAFLKSYYNYWFGTSETQDSEALNHVAFRLFFEKTVGFPDKKLRLLLDFKSKISQEKLFEKFANPGKSSSQIIRRSNIQG
ncbi:unnamed protein product [Caenorhabditis angaria]|uniref:3-beta hydroxysteroid dehydrogenase/isomerase domain-containing protein n=1 Tax=Caenorhabditis angaria TaxID=860376 RepID=A0A9P1MYQ6_9PELO|nr:unnamed protein product [Caenorhabditis angaria]